MKANIHPEYMKTKVRCNGCGTEFETRSTIPEITVEICSVCHPFYTGKQKLVDTAGRVDKFKARQLAASRLKSRGQKSNVESEKMKAEEIEKIEEELEDKTVNLPGVPVGKEAVKAAVEQAKEEITAPEDKSEQ